MYSSIATVCLSGTLEEKIIAASEAGFEGIEIFENDLTSFTGTVEEAAKLIKAHGLKLVTLQPFRDFEGLSGKYREQAFFRAERKFDLMEDLGTDLLMICSSVHPAAESGLAKAAEDFYELGERAAKRGFRVAFEALAWGKHIHDYPDSWEVVRQANHDNVGLVLDTFHIFSRGTELNSIANIPGDKIFLVQTADAPKLSMDHLSWSRHYRCFPGQGELEINEFMNKLAATKYDGPLSHEIFNDIFRMGNSKQVARDGLCSYRLMSNMIGETVLPDMQTINGIEFIEIRTRPDELDNLRQVFKALGMQFMGNHPTKPAERWNAGGINLILNSDPEFAANFSGKHTTSACTFGLRVENAYDTIKRAEALGYSVMRADETGASHGMDCIKGVDGAYLYIVDSATASKVWDTEFQSDSAESDSTTLNRVDHISISLPYQIYLSVVMQFRSLFKLQGGPAFDVTDPRGLIQSQVLCSDARQFQLVLNTSSSPATTSNQFLQKEGEAGVQHIALLCDDIFAIAKSCEEMGIGLLPIPENYYRDLQARFGFNDEETEQLKAHNILVDEDAYGRFWQLYTLPVSNAFFFEIVQRDGYRGFGEANAFIRTTAQQNWQTHQASSGN